MADSTTNIPQIGSSDVGKEVKMNGLIDALSKPSAFGRNWVTSVALTWGYMGVDRWYINATPTTKANGTLALTASGTRYVNLSRALAVSQASGAAFDADKLALSVVTTGASSISGYEDHRDPHHIVRFLWGQVDIAMGGSSKTLTYAQAMCEVIRCTGSSAALLDLIVPTVPRGWIIHADTSGGGGIQVKTSSGTGITIGDGRQAIVRCDGTNVLRVTRDCSPTGANMIQESFSISSGAISAPKFLSSVPATITVLPGSGATALVQFSTASISAINTHYNAGAWSGTAVDWFDWDLGSVTADAFDGIASPVTALRVTATGGAVDAQLVQQG